MASLQDIVGKEGKPAPLALLAMAWMRLVGPVVVRGSAMVAQNGTLIESESDLMRALKVPGLALKGLVNVPKAQWIVTSANADKVQLAKSASDLAWLIGQENVRVVEALANLWQNCRKTGLWTSDQVDRAQAACRIGMLAFPTSARSIANLAPGITADLMAPVISADQRAGYDALVAEFKAVISAYLRGAYESAAVTAENSAHNVAVWDAIYNGVKAVRDLPGNVVGAVGDATLGFAGSFFKRTWYLFALAAVGAFIFFNRSALAQKANHAAGKAVGI